MSKSPEDCAHMADIRVEIDSLDKQIIALIGQRYLYVKAASRFKKNETDVKAPDRFKSMLAERRKWATENGLAPDAIEKMYFDLVNHFIDEEMKHWKDQQ